MPSTVRYPQGKPAGDRFQRAMNTFLEILSQLFWAITAGALIAAVIAGAKIIGVIGGVIVGGMLAWRWMKKRKRDR